MAHPARSRRLLLISLVCLLVTSFLPLRWSAWVSWFGDLAEVAIAPASNPFSAVSRWLRPADLNRPDDETLAALDEELRTTQTLLLQSYAENGRLQRLIEELQRGLALNPDMPVQQLNAPVYGTAGDLARGVLRVRAGSKQGVALNTVAAAAGLQLIGRVMSVEPRTCTVLPITARSAGPFRAMIMIDDTLNGLRCTLEPVGDGTLRGDVEDRRDPVTAEPILPEVGQDVRLDDPQRWPRSAQMLLVGKVERVDSNPSQPLRKVVVVRPTIDRMERLTEVLLRITPSAFEEERR